MRQVSRGTQLLVAKRALHCSTELDHCANIKHIFNGDLRSEPIELRFADAPFSTPASKGTAMPVQGSCLCRSVQYEIDELASPIGFCHCHTCRKAHAAAAAPTARVRRDNFRWLAGSEFVRNYESSPGKTRHFCGECGSHIVAMRTGQEEYILRVATLDDDPVLRPVIHIWTAHDVPWLAGENLPWLPEALS